MPTDSQTADVIIIGAGLSGIGAAVRLRDARPQHSLLILEGREAIGGTWDLFRYPGVRSDSDMFTLGYPFRPWRGAKAIAAGADILRYIRDTADAHDITDLIRFNHHVRAASWSSTDSRWTLEVSQSDDSEIHMFQCRFLYLCSGYYRYDHGHDPVFPGRERFNGEVIHPQHWPQDFDATGKRVVVIGSGATAITLVPALAKSAAHVTMLQRSPTYIFARPDTDAVASAIRSILPDKLGGAVNQLRMTALTALLYQVCRRYPARAREVLLGRAARQLPEGYPVERHFGPSYAPWDQRLCVSPSGDIFEAISEGRAEVITDTIATFTETGITTTTGANIDADVIVTATGLDLVAFGGIEVRVNDHLIDPAELVFYKAVMLSGLPNFAVCAGYTNASWTLRADLSSRWVARLLCWMDAHGHKVATPDASAVGPDTVPAIDLTSGYVERARSTTPRRGLHYPWSLHQNYFIDRPTMLWRSVSTPDLRFQAGNNR